MDPGSPNKKSQNSSSIDAEEGSSSQNVPEKNDQESTTPSKKQARKRRSSEISATHSEETLSPDKVWRQDEESQDTKEIEQQKAQTKKEEERKLMALICHFQEDQLNRFEDYRRASFPKTSIRRIMQSVVSCPISQNIVIAMAGITKVFAGEIIEDALSFKEQNGDDGPLQPKHIREAVRKFKNRECLRHFHTRNPIL